MSHNQKETKVSESSTSHTYAQETEQNKSQSDLNELVERKSIPKTPFDVVGNEENGYFIAIGRWKLTEEVETKQEAIDLLITQQWQITVNLICTLHEAILKEFVKEPDEMPWKED